MGNTSLNTLRRRSQPHVPRDPPTGPEETSLAHRIRP